LDLHAWLDDRMPMVEALLDRVLPPLERAPSSLHGAMRHNLFPGGKRLRPALAMAAAEAVGAPAATALPIAAAVELVHAYSLIHDDLPCMDDDDERRGRPTVHVLYGEATAVLAGDALQSLAFEVLLDDADAVLAARAGADLARAIGAAGLVGGQADDLAAGSREAAGAADAEAILSIHERKTAALISVSVGGGARLAGVDSAVVDQLARFGREIGVAFQIADDLLDADDDEGSSLVPLLGPDACRRRAEALLDAALARIEGFGDRAEPLRELARFAVRRNT
jgi:geranylgeranyl pyrophosphate synthase